VSSVPLPSGALAPGARLGPYEIESFLGAGGMGHVYRARDTRLDRIVAIKVVAESRLHDALFRARFLQEARALSRVTHPHICTLFDVGHQDGVDFLVMEYVEGETLAARLRRGRMPIDTALRHAIEIAAALSEAHRQGIIHRDIKPGNIMLTKSGVKLLDFGLARLSLGMLGEMGSGTDRPTFPQSEAGTIIGTLHYLAPEQLEGKAADARTDLFAFGTVLYEMLTGRSAFEGTSTAGVMAAILEQHPPAVSTVRDLTGYPFVEEIVQRCLAKDPDERIQSAHDLRLVLQWMMDHPLSSGRSHGRWQQRALLGAFAIALLLVPLVLVKLWSRWREPRAAVVRSAILPPEGSHFRFEDHGAVALSPDGTRLAFAAVRPDGTSLLWIRDLADGSITSMEGTDGAFRPFWAPDGRHLGYFTPGKLKRVSASGGPSRVLCDALGGMGGSWNDDGVIIFSPSPQSLLFRVSASGGIPTPITTTMYSATREFNHAFPSFLPDGSHFLFLARSSSSQLGRLNRLYVGSLDGGKPELLLDVNSNAVFAPPGYLVYARDGALVAQPFDPDRRALSGEPRPLASSIRHLAELGAANVSISRNGYLVFQSRGQQNISQLLWVSRSGKPLGSIGSPADYDTPRLSHNGDALLAGVVTPGSGNLDVWSYDLRRNTKARLTFSPADEGSAIWSPNDQEVVFWSNRDPKNPGKLFIRTVANEGSEKELPLPGAFFPNEISGDGRFLLFGVSKGQLAGFDLWAFSFADRRYFPVVSGDGDQWAGTFSPDGGWIAYGSAESGREEVYVQRFSGGGKWQISSSGGFYPKWSADGKEIFFESADGKLMAASVETRPAFRAGDPQPLFAFTSKRQDGRQWDVSPDGKRFVLNVVTEQSPPPFTLVQNWTAELDGR